MQDNTLSSWQLQPCTQAQLPKHPVCPLLAALCTAVPTERQTHMHAGECTPSHLMHLMQYGAASASVINLNLFQLTAGRRARSPAHCMPLPAPSPLPAPPARPRAKSCYPSRSNACTLWHWRGSWSADLSRMSLWESPWQASASISFLCILSSCQECLCPSAVMQLMHTSWATLSPSRPRAHLPAFPPTYPPAYPTTYLPASRPAVCCPPAAEHFCIPVPASHCRASHYVCCESPSGLMPLPSSLPHAAPVFPA